MKTYSEMANDALCRIKKQKKINKKRRNIICGAAAFCALALSVVILSNLPEQLLTQDYQSEDSGKDAYLSEQFNQHGDNKIVFNSIDGIGADRMKINLAAEDKVTMTLNEYLEYYGTNIFPNVPQDLKIWEDPNSCEFEIFRRDGGTGQVYYDQCVINYSNQDFTRSINIETAKGKYPYSCIANWELGDFEMSRINGTQVFLAQSDGGYRFAEFMYEDVGFHIIFEGLTEVEIVDVITSLLK